ncbi:MAG: hypothetical protein GWN00_02365, partial [Aliifodinibius sp.]|nr:hypothetical protein [candidate division Zixibacteria bacterium]NIT55118.1 hypothetical protein [Fodinibius sp.]NIW43501.1 hypothetical protein [Gammaproteobacteria bacterium]NIS44655.1 hypothetical protein [candidate division Zixibacteria bacterium]NIU12712.1 hypothetical protein [candidate division Zixibacteria bacterium]
SDLMVGHYVEVEAELQSNGTYLADQIELEDDIEVEGVIQDIGSDSLIVMGVIFFVDANTEIRDSHGNPISFSDLQVGDFVEVEADLQPDGTYLATRIELEDDGEEIEVEGHIEAIGADSVVVNSIVFFVDSSTVILDDDNNPISFSDLEVGDEVEITAILRPDGTYLATRIKLEDDELGEIEVEGHIEAIGADSVVVNSIVFFVNSSTVILDDDNNPISLSDLGVGDEVEITAILRPDGTYLATRIKLEDDELEEIEITAPIDTLFGDSIGVAGIIFWTDSNTLILDDHGQPISFSDLQNGMIVEIRGEIQPDGSIYATRIKVEDFFQDEIEVEGFIDSLGTDHLLVRGITFYVDANTL